MGTLSHNVPWSSKGSDPHFYSGQAVGDNSWRLSRDDPCFCRSLFAYPRAGCSSVSRFWDLINPGMVKLFVPERHWWLLRLISFIRIGQSAVNGAWALATPLHLWHQFTVSNIFHDGVVIQPSVLQHHAKQKNVIIRANPEYHAFYQMQPSFNHDGNSLTMVVLPAPVGPTEPPSALQNHGRESLMIILSGSNPNVENSTFPSICNCPPEASHSSIQIPWGDPVLFLFVEKQNSL